MEFRLSQGRSFYNTMFETSANFFQLVSGISMTCGSATRGAEKLRFSGSPILDCGGYAAVAISFVRVNRGVAAKNI
jgi:hypothetical protein